MREGDLSGLRWRFVPVDRRGFIRWHWQVWTHDGRLLEASTIDFETLTECEESAKAAGWLPPELR